MGNHFTIMGLQLNVVGFRRNNNHSLSIIEVNRIINRFDLSRSWYILKDATGSISLIVVRQSLLRFHDYATKLDDAAPEISVQEILFFAGSFKSQLIDYFSGHIVSWEAFGRFMLIRTKWRFWTSWRHFGCTLWRSQLLCSWRNFNF